MCVLFVKQRLDENVVRDFEEGDFIDQECQDPGQVADQGKASI